MDAERIKELERIEEMWDEMTEAIVGAKMIPATPEKVRALALDAERFRWLVAMFDRAGEGSGTPGGIQSCSIHLPPLFVMTEATNGSEFVKRLDAARKAHK